MLIEAIIGTLLLLCGAYLFIEVIISIIRGEKRFLIGPYLFMYGHKGSMKNMLLKYKEYPYPFIANRISTFLIGLIMVISGITLLIDIL